MTGGTRLGKTPGRPAIRQGPDRCAAVYHEPGIPLRFPQLYFAGLRSFCVSHSNMANGAGGVFLSLVWR